MRPQSQVLRLLETMERQPSDTPASQRERRVSPEWREQRPAPFVEADLLSVDSIGVCSLNNADGRSDAEDQEPEATASAVEKRQTKHPEHQGSIEPASGTTVMSTVPIVGSLEELQEEGRKHAATTERKPAGTTAGTGTGAGADAREEKQGNMMQTPAHWKQAQAQLREDSAAEEQAIKSAYDSANATAKQHMDPEKEAQYFQPAEFPAPTSPMLHEMGAPQDANAMVQPNQQGAEFPDARRNEETTSMGTLDSIGKRSVRWSMDEHFEIAPLSPMSSIATSVESPLNHKQEPPFPVPIAPVSPPPFWTPSVQEESNSMTTTSCSSSSSHRSWQGSWQRGWGGPRAEAPWNPYSPYPAFQAPREAPFLPWTPQTAPACPLGPVATRRRGPPHTTAAAKRKLGRSNTTLLYVHGGDPPEPPPPPPPRFCPWTPEVKNVGLFMVRGDDPPEIPAWSASSIVLPPPEPTPLPKKCRCRRRAKKEQQKEVKKKRSKKLKQDQPKRKGSELGREPRLRIRCHPRPEWVF